MVLAALEARIATLEVENASLRGDVARIATLEVENASLRGDVARIATLELENAYLRGDVAMLKTGFTRELTARPGASFLGSELPAVLWERISEATCLQAYGRLAQTCHECKTVADHSRSERVTAEVVRATTSESLQRTMRRSCQRSLKMRAQW